VSQDDGVRYTLFLPTELHEHLKDLADRDLRNLRQEIVYGLWQFVNSRPEYHANGVESDGQRLMRIIMDNC